MYLIHNPFKHATRSYFNDVILIHTYYSVLAKEKFSKYCLTSALLNFQIVKISFLCSDIKTEQEMPGRNYEVPIHLHALAICYFPQASNWSTVALLFVFWTIVLYLFQDMLALTLSIIYELLDIGYVCFLNAFTGTVWGTVNRVNPC